MGGHAREVGEVVEDAGMRSASSEDRVEDAGTLMVCRLSDHCIQ